MSYLLRIFLLFVAILCPHTLHADEEDAPKPPPKISQSELPSYYQKDSPFKLKILPDRRRSIFIPQLVTYFLPGFDQFLEQQYDSALIYAATGVAGLAYANHRAQQLGADNLKKAQKDAYDSKDNYYRGYNFGNQVYQLAGGLSTYHSFRTAVRSRQQYGEFIFLREEETRSELLLAPLRFDFVTRKTTWIPLLIATGFAILENTPRSLRDNERKSSPLKSADYFYSSAAAYEAGISEESVFRGWLLPATYHETNNLLLSNILQAGAFGLAHLGTVNVPIIQGLFGYYLGMLTIDNNWTISEAIFIHTWWDVIAFLSGYSNVKANPNARIRPAIVVPLEWHF